jgi:FkbM family methyltransferase
MPNLVLKFSPGESCLHTGIGRKVEDRIVVENCSKGTVLYGPYINLGPGEYLAAVTFDTDETLAGSVLMDVCTGGSARIASARCDLRKVAKGGGRAELRFALEQSVTGLEIRVFCVKNVSATVHAVELTRTDPVANAAAQLGGATAASDLGGRLQHLELLCRGGRATFVGNNRVLSKVVVGGSVLAFLMPADDLLLMPETVVRGIHEAGLTAYLCATVTQSDHCLDVGANYGYYTCLMARLAPLGKTLGVEPNEPLCRLVRDNVFSNSLQPTADAVHAAVSDRSGRLTLYRRPLRSGNTSIAKVSDALVQKLGEPDQEPFEVDCVTIDELRGRMQGRIDVMKIDVEGAEPLAFRGARQTIAANPNLKIVMEWAPGQIRGAGFDLREFLDDLAAQGLRSAIIQGNGMLQPIPLPDLINQRYFSGVLLTRR